MVVGIGIGWWPRHVFRSVKRLESRSFRSGERLGEVELV